MKVRRSVAVSALMIPIAALLATPSPGWAAPAAPQACHSDEGWIFTPTVNGGLILDGAGSPKILHNGTSHVSTLTLSQSGTATSSWTVTDSGGLSGGLDFGVIKVGSENTLGGSYTKSHAYSDTVSASISVGAGRYGILQGGTFRRKVTGTYAFNNGMCVYTKKATITAKLPKPADGFDTAENASGNVPWDA
jgi:hypothetical protein